MIDKMTRYDFILLSGDKDSFLSRLQELGIVDIERSSKDLDADAAELLGRAEELKARIALLEKNDFGKDPDYASILSLIGSVRKEIDNVKVWGEIDKTKISAILDHGYVMRFYSCAKKTFNPDWAGLYPLEIIEDDGKTVWFVTIGQKGESYDFPVASCDTPKRPASAAAEELKELEQKLEVRTSELMKEKEGLDSMKEEYRKTLSQFDFSIASNAVSDAAEGSLCVFTGFAPSSEDERLTSELDKLDAFYLSSPAVTEDNPPIKLKNNRFVGMFEVLTDMYGRPSYNGFDPTPYISVFFMLFFAMCMGDAGYGIILMVVGYLLKKVQSFSKFSPLVITLGAATFVVGFLFHTFFSIDISQWEFIKSCGLDRIMVPAQIGTYDGTMVLALAIGVVHLCLAMIVKTVYATKNKGFLGSLGTWGWTLLIVGGVIFAAIAISLHLDSNIIKWGLIVLGGISAIGIFLLNDLNRNPLLNIGSGLWEAYNTATGILGDVLSYLRLYALGLAGGMLGFAFNDLAKMTLGDGGFGWIPFILIAVIGHALNIAMAVLGAFVHPLRLNFLEFFKNSDYEGSGRNYNPLKQ